MFQCFILFALSRIWNHFWYSITLALVIIRYVRMSKLCNIIVSLFHLRFFDLINSRSYHTFNELLLCWHITLKHKIGIDIILIIFILLFQISLTLKSLCLLIDCFFTLTRFHSTVQIRILCYSQIIVLRVIVHGAIFYETVSFFRFCLFHIPLRSLICYIIILVSFENRLHHWLFFSTLESVFKSTSFQRIEAPIRIVFASFWFCSRFLFVLVRLHRCVAFISKTL